MSQTLVATDSFPMPATGAAPADSPLRSFLTTAVIVGPESSRGVVHVHPEGMIVWPAEGTVEATVAGSARALSVGEGVWVPAFTPHAIDVDGVSIGCCTSLADDVAPAWHSVGTVQLSASFRELLLHLAHSPMESAQRHRAEQVVVGLLPDVANYVEAVPVPRDERLAPLVRRVLDDPADDRGVEAWAWQLSLSVRTIARIFAAELGMTFSHWRTMVRMTTAARMLGDGIPVGTVARRVGYATTSAFSAAFRRAMGSKPSDWRP